jgi:hypothetical protein
LRVTAKHTKHAKRKPVMLASFPAHTPEVNEVPIAKVVECFGFRREPPNGFVESAHKPVQVLPTSTIELRDGPKAQRVTDEKEENCQGQGRGGSVPTVAGADVLTGAHGVKLSEPREQHERIASQLGLRGWERKGTESEE